MSSETPPVYSQGFNFSSFTKGGVDARTGQYTCSVTLYQAPAQARNCPPLKLYLSYDPMNRHDIGFGTGWSLNLSCYRPGNNGKGTLYLSTGENYKVTEFGDLKVEDQKLVSFHFKKDDRGYYVVHKSGLIETLSDGGGMYDSLVTTKVYASNGRSLTLSWTNSRPTQLVGIQDGAEDLLQITYAENQVDVVCPSGEADQVTSTFSLTRDDSSDGTRQLVKFQLPEDNAPPRLFTYKKMQGFQCLTQVTSPNGQVEDIAYWETGHQMPEGAPYKEVPRVQAHIVRPDQEQPPITTKYEFSSETNFLGYGSGYPWDEDGDTLFKSAANYEYTSTVTVTGGAATVNTYNKFHLLISSKKTQGTKQVTQKTDYYAEPNVGFEGQRPYYQLPKRVQTTYTDQGNGASRTETTLHTFDNFGNLIHDTQVNGVKTDRTYYPAEGEDNRATGEICAKDEHGFIQHLKTETVTPTSSPYVTPIRSTKYTYTQLKSPEGAWTERYTVIERMETLQDGTPTASVEYAYFVNAQSQVDSGRLKHQRKSFNGKLAMDKNWTYDHSSKGVLTESVQVVTPDGCTSTERNSYSTYSGLVRMHEDEAKVRTVSKYDKINRLVKLTTSPDSRYQATQEYEYTAKPDNGGYTFTKTDCKGVRVRYTLDGLNRIRQVEKQEDNRELREGALYGGTFRVIEQRTYNMLNQCVEKVEIDWLPGDGGLLMEQRNVLSYEFDDWGQNCKVSHSNGLVTISNRDPIHTTQTDSIKDQGKEQSQFDGHAVVKMSSLTKDGTPYSAVDYSCDGLGRIIQHSDDSGHTIRYEYDGFDRAIRTTWPDERVAEVEYASHSSEVLPVSVKANGTVLGQQVYDGLDRLTTKTISGRTSTQSFEGSTPKPFQTKTPKGDVCSFVYDPHLQYAITRSTTRDDTEMYAYDRKTAAVTQCKSSYTTENLEYFPSGRLKSETVTIGGKELAPTKYSYSLRGRLLGYSDVHGATQEIQYDRYGRPERLLQGNVEVSFSYDQNNRLCEGRVTDTKTSTSLDTQLMYDEFGRETQRSVNRGDSRLYALSQSYDKSSRLTTRALKDGANSVLREETFQYDNLDRLVDYQCRGHQAPKDESGRPLAGQQFTFNSFNGLKQVSTSYQDGSQNVASYAYSSTDPTQVTRISNTLADRPAEVNLEYDANGCLIRDEQGRVLEYDTTSRLTAVRSADSKILSQYRYDARGRLICQTIPGKGDTYLHYRADKLVAVTTPDSKVSFVLDGEIYWGQISQQGSGMAQAQLWVADSHQSTLAWLDGQQCHAQKYGPYGYGDGASLIGFNGQWCDPVTGWYHLGQGYRVYNPVLMRFHSPDTWGIFTSGEINPYTYCVGDPINRTDPSGRFSLFGWEISGRDLALAIVGAVVSAVVGVLTGGASTAVEVGMGIAAGVASDVATGAVYDTASGKTPTWESVGTDAFYGAVGGVASGAAEGGLRAGTKAASHEVEGGLRAGKTGMGKTIERAERLGTIEEVGEVRAIEFRQEFPAEHELLCGNPPESRNTKKVGKGGKKNKVPKASQARQRVDGEAEMGAVGGQEPGTSQERQVFEPRPSRYRLDERVSAERKLITKYKEIVTQLREGVDPKKIPEKLGAKNGMSYERWGGTERPSNGVAQEIHTMRLSDKHRVGFWIEEDGVHIWWVGGHDPNGGPFETVGQGSAADRLL